MKARVKNIEDMSLVHRCCTDNIEALRPFVGRVLDITGGPFLMKNYRCPWCSADQTDVGYHVAGGADGESLPVGIIDIDEG